MEVNTTRECHCLSVTKEYRTRRLRGGKTVKIYHRCTNCGSRFVDIWVKEIDTAKSVSILYLHKKEMQQTVFSAPDCF